MRGVPPEKVSSVPHWVDMRQFEEAKRTNRFREKFGISKDKLIFFFGGILGPSQSLEFVLQIAERVKDLPDAVFLFVGDGTEKEKLMEIAKEKNLENVIFKPLVSKEEFPSLLKDADVGLVSLTSRNTTPIFPAKIPAYMAAGVPVLAFVNKESLRSTLIEEAKCGFVAESTDIGKAEELARKNVPRQEEYRETGRKRPVLRRKEFERRPRGRRNRRFIAPKRIPASRAVGV